MSVFGFSLSALASAPCSPCERCRQTDVLVIGLGGDKLAL